MMNRIRHRITRIRITDQGCMLRAYSRDIVEEFGVAKLKAVCLGVDLGENLLRFKPGCRRDSQPGRDPAL